MDVAYWLALAADYVSAYQQAFPTAGGAAERTPLRSTLLLAMSVAEHETNNGRAWPGTNNFGAVQLRGLTLQERAAFDDGALKAGDYTPSRDGVLHVDTHPTPSGSIPYPVWFAAFDRRVDGIAHFLRTLWRLSAAEADEPDSTPMMLATQMYIHGYYEGDHAGGRPVGKRAATLTPPEVANVGDYGGAVSRCLAAITADLASWDYGRDANLEPSDGAA